MKSKKMIAMMITVSMLAAAFAGCLGDDDDKTTVKIGFMNPLTGPLEPDASGFSWGASEAIKDLNAMYDDYEFELVEVDSGCDGAVSGPAASTLVDSGVVAVAGAACSGASMGANAVLSAASIPMISYASTNPGLSDATAYPLFYRVVPSDAIQGPAGADAMTDAGQTATGLAILHMTNDYGSGLADAIGAAWNATAGNALCSFGMVGYEDTTTNFQTQAEALVAATDCTGVYLSSYITDAAAILEALSAANYTGKIFAGDGPAGIGLYEKLSDNTLAANMIVTAPRAGTSYGDFEARYDADAASIGSIKTYVLTTYDAVMIIGKAAAMDGAINDNIKSVGTSFQGASGMHSFLANGDVGGDGYDICTYDGAAAYTCAKYWTATGGVQASS